MLRKKSRQRGAVLTEYIIILAYIAAIASSFISDGGLADAAKEAAAIAKEDIIVALGGQPSSPYKVQFNVATEADEKFKKTLDSLINDLYRDLGTEEAPLREIWIDGSGNLATYSLHNLSNLGNPFHITDNNININDLYLKDSEYKISGNNSTHIMFTPEGKVDTWIKSNDDWQKCSRIYLKKPEEPNNSFHCLTYNSKTNSFSETENYWKEL